MPRRVPSKDYLVLKPIVPGRMMMTASERLLEYKRMEDRKSLFTGLSGTGGDGPSPYLQDQTLTNSDFKLPYIKEDSEPSTK